MEQRIPKGQVRTRFAPSPTGYMHIGNLRTALYCYLIARHAKGVYILRIEDTDQGRFVADAEDVIVKTLAQCGLVCDESPALGGPVGPYVQSERKEIYARYANLLIEKGAAYRCFCTSEELEARKGDSLSGYDGHCANLSQEEIDAKIAAGVPYVIRQRIPKEGSTTFEDAVFGSITVNNDELDDNILLKSDVLGLGLLFAPKSGKETRKDLSKMINDLYEKAKDIDVEEVKNAIIVKTKELENTIKDLDKETAKQLIVDKSKEVKIKAQELVDLAVEKGTPIVEKNAKEVKSKTAELLKNTAEKLEEPKKTKKTTKKAS